MIKTASLQASQSRMKGSRDRSQYKKEAEKRSAAAAGGRSRLCRTRVSRLSPKDADESEEDWEFHCCSRAWTRQPSWNHKKSRILHVDIDKSECKQISTLAHAMVQHRLDQMIREAIELRYRCRMTAEVAAAARRRGGRRMGSDAVAGTTTAVHGTVMVVVEKCSEDPRQDFVDSVATMITATKLREPNDLRALLDYYMSINPQQLHAIILDAFYQVCTDMFSSSKRYCYSADF